MNVFYRLGVLLLLAGLLAPAAWAQRATLTGTVTDADDGEPLPGANIIVTTAGGTSMVGGAATDLDGNYTVAGLEAGTYDVVFRYVGYGEQQQTVTLAAGATERLDVALTQEGFDLDAVVITASRRQEKVLDAPASISVLDAREIETNVGTSSIEALKQTTGVDYAQTGIDRREVVLRGFNNAFSGATYVLTDYRQAAVPSLGVNVYSIMPNMNLDVERVEVVRGPGSALYGAGVDAGVIHFITKDPFRHPGVSVSVSGGERSYFNVQGRVAGVLGENLGVKVTGQYGQADDWELDPNDPLDALQLAGDVITPRRSEFDKININGSAEYRIDEGTSLIVNGGYSALTSAVLSGIGTVQADNFGYSYGQVRFQRGPFFAQVYANINDAGDSFVYDSGVAVVDKGALYNAQAQYDFLLLDGREQLIVGVDLELTRPDTEGTILGRNEDDDAIDEYGVYAQSTTSVSEAFDVTLGLRGDYNNVVEKVQVSPRAALVYKLNPTNTVRATYNRAFSSPGTNSNFLDIRAAVNPVGGGNSLVFMGRGAASGFTFDNFRASNTAAFSLGVPGFFGQAVPVAGVPLTPIYAAFASQVAATLTDPNGAPPPPFNNLPLAQRAALAQILGGLTQFIPLTATTQGTLGIPDASAQGFSRVSGPVDIQPLDQTITQTLEVGYKGLLGDKLLVAVDGYYTKKNDFIGPLAIESPLVYLQRLGPDLAATLTPIIQGAAAQDPQIAGFLASIGLTPETAAGLLGTLAAAGFATTPVAVVQPDEAVLPAGSPATEVGGFLSYRNFGDVDYFGTDVSVQFLATDQISFFVNGSFVNDDFFDAEELGEENEDLTLALNAPRIKAKVGASYRQAGGFSVDVAGRYVDSFPVDSGPYVGTVEDAFLVDLNAGYDFDRLVPGLRFGLGVSNLLDDDYRQFVGAPQIGRMIIGRLTYTTP